MLINDHAINFELYQIARSHEREVLDGVLAYRLSANIANLTEEEKHLYKTTDNEIKYKIMKKQVKKLLQFIVFERRSIINMEGVKLEQNYSFYVKQLHEKEHTESSAYSKSYVKDNSRHKQSNYQKRDNKII